MPPAAAGADAAPDPFARMLGGGPWTAKFPSVAAMMEADLASFLRSFGFPAIPSPDGLRKLCTGIWRSIPRDDCDVDYGRKAQKTLVPGSMISTSCAVWLLEGFANHSGIEPRVPGCAGPFTAQGRRCLVDFDRRKCNDEQRVFTDAETVNVFTRDEAAHEKFEREAKKPPNKRADLTGASQAGQTSGPSRPDLERTLRKCWAALQSGCQFAYLQVSSRHASVGVIDTRQGSLGSALCERFCSLHWPPDREERRFVEHLLEKLGMLVTWGEAETASQVGPDCQFRGTFKLLEHMFGTLGGTSSPDADVWTVHVAMQIARTWTMCRMAEEAHTRWPQKRQSLLAILGAAVTAAPAAPRPPPSQQPAAEVQNPPSTLPLESHTTILFVLIALPPTPSPTRRVAGTLTHACTYRCLWQ